MLIPAARACTSRPSICVAAVVETASEWRQLVESRDLQFTQASRGLRVAGPGGPNRPCNDCWPSCSTTPSSTRRRPGPSNFALRRANGNAIISVCDSGIGIAKEDQARIFERFYRVDKARSRELGGAGIGLAIADWIVQQHRGSIAVHSSIGNGSSFVVELPMQPGSAVLDRSQTKATKAFADMPATRQKGLAVD